MLRRRTADRRAGQRFDVVGDLSAAFAAHLVEPSATASGPDVTTTVNVVDIGPGGALLATPAPPPCGQRGVLTLTLSTGSIATEVEIRHLTAGPWGGPSGAGAAFGRMDDDSRRTLARFLETGT